MKGRVAPPSAKKQGCRKAVFTTSHLTSDPDPTPTLLSVGICIDLAFDSPFHPA